jgi:hypothetical protein
VISLPERSMTRFFIPLIDVLLLLFCIYLLMPLASGTENGGSSDPADLQAQARKLKQQLDQLRQEREDAARKLADLRQEKSHLLNQRLGIKVLEIDPRSGKLYTFERGLRVDILSAEDAERLIKRHEQEVGGRDLYYLFLFPRQDTGYPEQRQFEQYERWFARAAHGLDNPRGGR